MEMGLYQQQSMNLVMTTELRQAIAILQVPSYELTSYLQEQALENPLIEIAEPKGMFTTLKKSGRKNGVSSQSADKQSYDHLIIEQETLYDYLYKQSILLPLQEQDRKIFNYLLLSLNESGYLTVTAQETAARFTVSIKKCEELISMLQKLEPTGIGARSLRECLLIQLSELKFENTLSYIIVDQYLELLGERKIKTLAELLKVSPQQIEEAADFLQTLDPRPGAAFSPADEQSYLYPDVSVSMENGKLHISINEQYSPVMKLNNSYSSLLRDKNIRSKFIDESYQKFNWLKKALEQRKETLLKITSEIVRVQEKYFHSFEKNDLIPLTLKDVADQIGVHESTVSRAVKNKVLQTSKGAVELKSFFSAKIYTQDGGSASATSAKTEIKKLVESENKLKPLSDQVLAALLEQNSGLSISRRTVAKYREELNIPSSSKRKRYS
ncbi:RNA polymerase factor sigma-54 [Fictibacillus sp. BK138]|uniref:RNA polymerase factor sigma-54 n=1 Tax=Fictibacillus sp. BK138 TaxID=2512121 RepID=UPI0010F0A085|nr:RNA polymerase factor sigma-54 [Fictibacillus sp. BK138]RZT21723.1 RNA polymerase RpoN-/SigL-like sigma 54 subunit [Fictibacillus sp. BK138]